MQRSLGVIESISLNTDVDTITKTKPYFTMQVLTGGLTNHIARITFDKPLYEVLQTHATNPDLLEKVGEAGNATWKSVVLKHAPPYIASDPSQAMSVDRQLIEKKALEVLNSREGTDGFRELFVDEQGASREGNTIIQIPKLIWHDRDRNVLWIEDLGRMRTLSEILLDPVGLSDPNRRLGEESNMGAQIQQVAADLGSFLARLYKATTNPPSHLLDDLKSSSNSSGINEYLANMVLENLQRPEAEVSSAEVEVLAERVRVGLSESEDGDGGVDEVCLGMVDFWPESVLVELGEGSANPRCGLVDWEYFGPSNAASELGMFLAHLHVHMLNTKSSSETKERIQLFAGAMFQAYAQSQPETDWKPSNRFKRSALLSHGRELVNGVAMYHAKLDDTAKARILKAGIRSLRASGELEAGVDLGLLSVLRS
ncbi:hypothetical protein GALMADRAFT_141440 [Galerina marginata CBS 339.88]|uniref:Uncharacterized protein n=1 Tax=Galerina marginata (strain CBS 339.88) TaxID=685588 RepID=A0A067SWH3_GALM3|nr:hypothetical protein GALMADRAFT_141440 [Galerina marginata CBS 339.88]